MDFFGILMVSIALAMDAFAVSITSGMAIRKLRLKRSLLIALSFGLFQGAMPVVGWLAGESMAALVASVDHWIAFALLLAIGLKMIYESIKLAPGKSILKKIGLKTLLILSIATSIDAFAVGLSFAFLKIDIIWPAITIAVVTFVLSLIGTAIGTRAGTFFEKKIGIAGGLILIGIGVKILAEHLFLL